MGHLQNNCTGHCCEIINADVFEKETLIQKTHVERTFTTTAAHMFGKKDETHRCQVSQQGHTPQLGELCEHAAYNQPYRLREKIHLGRLKKQTN